MTKLSKLKARNQSKKNFNKKLSRGGKEAKKTNNVGKNKKKTSITKKFISRQDRPTWALGDITADEFTRNEKTDNKVEVDIEDLMDMMDKEDDQEKETMQIDHRKPKTVDFERQYRLKLLRQREIEEKKSDKPKKLAISKIEDKEEVEDDDDEKKETKPLDLIARPFVELFAQRANILAEVKVRFACIGSAVMEHPTHNIHQLGEFFRVLDSTNDDEEYGLIFFSAQKLAFQSLAVVFEDILPTYKVAMHAPTPSAPGQQLKRDTIALYQYEKSLLNYYQLYLQRLERCINSQLKPLTAMRSNFYSVMLSTREARISLALVACRCLGSLLEHHSGFNEVGKVIALLASVLCNTAKATPTMRQVAADAFRQLFETDKLGEVSLEATRTLCQKIVDVNFRVVPAMLRVFHSLNLRELINNQGELDISGRELREQAKRDRNQMSKAERKKAKELGKQNNQRLEAEAMESREKRFHFKQEIHKHLSALYFKFLKRCLEVAKKGKLLEADDSKTIDFNQWYRPLLRTLLEGVVIFSVYLNEDIIYNLIDILRKLIDCFQEVEEDDHGFGTAIRLEAGVRLDCLRTIFRIIATNTTTGNLISIDFEQLYQQLYRLLSNVQVVECETIALVRTLETMVLKRLKHINLKRIIAIVKRILLVIPALERSEVIVAMLTLVKRICQLNPLIGEHLLAGDDNEEAMSRPEKLAPVLTDLNMDHLEVRSAVMVLQLIATGHHDRYVQLLAQAMLINFCHQENGGQYSTSFDLSSNSKLAKLVKEANLTIDVSQEILTASDASQIYKKMKTSGMLMARLEMAQARIKRKMTNTASSNSIKAEDTC